MFKYHLSFSILFLSFSLTMISTNSNAQIIETDSVYQTKAIGFSQAVVSNGFVFVAGQVGWDKNYKLTEEGDFKAQAIQAMKNIDLILKKANSSISNIVQLRFYVTDISEKNRMIINELVKSYFPNSYKPTSTLLCVKALAREELMIEIEAIASIN
jgi:enamine deaminase RidA (YjgF/YER057c/UK114 family)